MRRLLRRIVIHIPEVPENWTISGTGTLIPPDGFSKEPVKKKEEKNKCVHCGQYGTPESECTYCGAPID